MNRVLVGTAWILLYVAVATSPAFLVALLPTAPTGRGFWTEFSVALGFIGFVQMLLQFVLVARFRSITAPYGIDIILYYHRQIGMVATLAVLAHPVILIARRPATAGLLNPLGGNWATRAGVVATFALALLVGLSIFRRQLRLNYEAWRVSHALLALVVVAGSLVHIGGIGAYVTTTGVLAAWVALSCVLLLPFGYDRLIRPAFAARRAYRVTGVERELDDMWTMRAEPVGHAGLAFEPGQFVWLKLGHPYNIYEHPFSMLSSSEHPGRLEFGIKEAGDFTRTVGDVAPGTRVYLEGPHGAFTIDRIPSAGYVFVAGGAGIVPFMSMIRTMADRADRRPVLLLYASRTESGLAYRAELEGLAARTDCPALRVVCILEEPPPGWAGESGRITPDLLRRVLPEERIVRDVLICGPDAMIAAVERSLLTLGLPASRLHTERFELV